MLVPLLILAAILVYCLRSLMTLKKEYFAIIAEMDDGNLLWYPQGRPVQPYLLHCYGSDPLQRAMCKNLRARAAGHQYGYYYPPWMGPYMGRY